MIETIPNGVRRAMKALQEVAFKTPWTGRNEAGDPSLVVWQAWAVALSLNK